MTKHSFALATVFAVVSGLMYGYGLTITSGLAAPFIKCTLNYDNIDNTFFIYNSIFAGSFFLGLIIGGFTVSLFSTKLSILTTLNIINIVTLLSGLLNVYPNFWLIVILRTIFGYICGISNVIHPVFASELVPHKSESRIKIIYSASISIGVIIAQLLNLLNPTITVDSCPSLPFWNWFIQIAGGNIVFAIALFIATAIYKHKVLKPSKIVSHTTSTTISKDATPSMNTKSDITNIETTNIPINAVIESTLSPAISQPNSVSPLEKDIETSSTDIEKIKETKEEINISVEETNSLPKESFYSKKNIKWVIYCIMIPVMNQLTGINAVIIYAPFFFENAGIQNILLIQLGLIGFWNFICNWISVFLIPHFSVKIFLFTSLTIMSLGGFLLFLSFMVNVNVLAIIGTLLYILGFGLGPSPLFYVLLNDVPKELQIQATSLAASLRYITNFIIVFAFSYLMDWIGDAWSFFVLFAITFILLIYFICVYPIKQDN